MNQKESGTNRVRILNLATTDVGGAGIASRYLNDFFNNIGYASILITKRDFYKKNVFSKLLLRIKDKIDYEKSKGKFNSKYSFFDYQESDSMYNVTKLLSVIGFVPEIIILHWTSNFLSAKKIKEISDKTNAKIFWLMMDNSPLTGGCHYPWDCEGFKHDCSFCPAIINGSDRDIAYKNLESKKLYLPKEINLIACSESDYLRAIQSSLFKNRPIHKLLFPINEHKFKPADKLVAKNHWGIASDSKVIFYGASSLNNLRKGEVKFHEILKMLDQQLVARDNKSKITILVAGLGSALIKLDLRYISIKSAGFLTEDNLVLAYQAADLFVSTTLEDSGPLMLNQSIMVGTPVVSFNIGVSLDLIINGITGYRSNIEDIHSMAMNIGSILSLSDKDYDEMSNSCRTLALNEFSIVASKIKWEKVLLSIHHEK